MSPNVGSSLYSRLERRKFRVAVLKVIGGFSKQGLVSRTIRNFSVGINLFVSSTRIGFKLWNWAVILPPFICETYLKSSFHRKWILAGFMNWFSGPLSYRVPWEKAPRTATTTISRAKAPSWYRGDENVISYYLSFLNLLCHYSSL